MKYLIILLSFILLSCGSRKVDLHKRINDIETNLSIKIKELESERKALSEYIYTENFRADSIIIEEAGKRKIYNPSSEKKEQKKETSEEKSKQTETDIDQSEIDKSQEKDKHIDRQQFSWWPIIILLAIILVAVYVFRKPLKRFFM